MTWEKLLGGVLRILTPLGARYFRPSLLQRFYLLWIFRNFDSLPAKVLTPSQLSFIESICQQEALPSLRRDHQFVEDAPIIGTLEQRPPMEALPERKPNQGIRDASSPLTADQRGS